MRIVYLLVMALFTIKSYCQVNMVSGSAEFNLPVFSWQDNKSRLSTGVSVAYSSGAGLKVNSVASNIGQGWNVIQGGVITRLQIGEPDDQPAYEGNGTAEDITRYPVGFFYDVSSSKGYSNHLTKYPIFKDKNHIYKQHNITAADKQMDQFTFQFNGRTGIFILGKDVSCNEPLLLGDSKLKIWFDIDETLYQQGIRTTISAFHIKDEQGLIYTFSKKETVKVLKTVYTNNAGNARLTQPSFKDNNVYYEKSVEGTSGEIKNPYVITAWHLEKIYDPLTNRSVNFYYHINQIHAEGGSSFSHYVKERTSPPVPETYSIISHATSLSQTPQIDSIKLPDGHRITFTYGADRADMEGDKVLSAISVKYENRFINKYDFKSNYIIRNRFGIPTTDFQKASSRLYLQSITKSGPDLKTTEKPYIFDYFMGSGAPYNFVPPPFFHLKDIWGYYNGDNSKSATGASIDPNKSIFQLSNMEVRGLCFLRGLSTSTIELNAKDGLAKNGLLRQIAFPEGGSLIYKYEQNKAVLNGQLTSVGGVHVSKTIITDGGYSNDCNHPVGTIYKYTLADGTLPSYWGVEYPVNTVTIANNYKPENKRFKLFKLRCEYQYQYPGIISRESAVALTSGQKLTVVLGKIMNSVGTVLQILDIIQFAAGATGPAALIIDAIATVVNIVLSCFITNSGQNTSMDIYYNSDLNASNPLPLQFKRVEVIPNDGSGGRIVYEFTSPDEYPVWFGTNPVYSMKQRYAYWAYGLPKRTAVYDQQGHIIEETINYYDTSHARKILLCPPVDSILIITGHPLPGTDPCGFGGPCDSPYVSYKNLIIKNSSQRSDVWNSPSSFNNASYTVDMVSNPDMKVEPYYTYSGRMLLNKTIKRVYEKGSNEYNQTTTEYSYNNADYNMAINYEINQIKTTLPNDDIYYQTFGYASPILTQNAIITTPVQSTESFRKSGSSTRYYISETVTDYTIAANGEIVPLKTKEQRFTEPQPESAMHFYNTPLPEYSITREFFYDAFGNNMGVISEGRRSVIKLYDYGDKFITATVINATPNEDRVSYTSFETDDFSRSGWTFTGTRLYGSSGITGYRSIILSSGKSLSAQLNTGKPYLLSFWAMAQMTVSGGAVLVKSSPTINGFTFYEYKIPSGTATVSITGAGNIDEVRLYPAHARMQTTAYDPVLGKIAECDQNNRITYYEYDGLGRLRFVKDEHKDVVKMYEYNEKTTHQSCPGLFENPAISEVFIKNDCGPGFVGSEVVYTIPAGKYTSSVSQDEVDFLVEKELAELGQAYANTQGTCKQVFTNDTMSESFTKEGCDAGYKGTTITYSVPAGRYTSTISKTDANEQAREEIDANGQAYVNAPGNASCVVDYDPDFQADENAPTQCEKSNGTNTGYVLILTTDVNPNSPTFNQTQWVKIDEMNTTACPVPQCTNCSGENKKCINGQCYTGLKVYTSSYQSGGKWICIYHYEWFDGSRSPDYTESSVFPCAIY